MTRRKPAPVGERLLATADDLFRRLGIRGVGVELIAAEAGTNKMTLYRHFESKDQLIVEWVRGILAQKQAAWDEIVREYPNDPRAQLVSWSRRTEEALAQMEDRGSPILNALAELPDEDHPARRLIDEHRRAEHDRILALCRGAGFDDPELVADQFYFLLEGAKCCVVSMGLRRVGAQLVRLVDSLVGAAKVPKVAKVAKVSTPSKTAKVAKAVRPTRSR